MQINFNPEILELQAVTAGPLGAEFELSRGDGDGFVQLVFFSSMFSVPTPASRTCLSAAHARWDK